MDNERVSIANSVKTYIRISFFKVGVYIGREPPPAAVIKEHIIIKEYSYSE